MPLLGHLHQAWGQRMDAPVPEGAGRGYGADRWARARLPHPAGAGTVTGPGEACRGLCKCLNLLKLRIKAMNIIKSRLYLSLCQCSCENIIFKISLRWRGPMEVMIQPVFSHCEDSQARSSPSLPLSPLSSLIFYCSSQECMFNTQTAGAKLPKETVGGARG